MFWRKEVVSIPEKYGTIERRTEIAPDEFEISTERVLLRQAEDIEVGGFRRKRPIYETRSERILIQPASIIEKGEGVTVISAKYKTVTKQVVCGYKYEYGLDNYFKNHFKTTFNAKIAEETLKLSFLGVLRFFLPTEFCEPLIGDILEEYGHKSQYFKKLTILWLLKEVIFTLSTILLDWFIKKIPISFKLGN